MRNCRCDVTRVCGSAVCEAVLPLPPAALQSRARGSNPRFLPLLSATIRSNAPPTPRFSLIAQRQFRPTTVAKKEQRTWSRYAEDINNYHQQDLYKTEFTDFPQIFYHATKLVLTHASPLLLRVQWTEDTVPVTEAGSN